jgi:PAS domain S-box-containing protein
MPRKKQPPKTPKPRRHTIQKKARGSRNARIGTEQHGFKTDGAERKRNQLLLNSLSVAAVAAQNALTPGELFEAMSKILQRIGIQSTVFMMDNDRSTLVVKYLSYSDKLLAVGKAMTGVEAKGYCIPVRNVREYREVVKNQSAVYIEDAADFLRRFLPKRAVRFSGKVAGLLGVKQFIVAPLVSEGNVFGLLTIQAKSLAESDISAIHVFASQLAGVWRKAELLEEAQEEIARRREAEAYLIEERDRFRSTLDIAGVILVALNAAGNVVMVNRKGQDVLGYAKQDLIGNNWFDTCLPADTRTEVRSIFRDLISGKGGLSEYAENKVVTRSGEERIIAWHNTVLRGAGGRITGTLSSGEDITERKKTEMALTASEKKFRTLVGSMHDIVFTLDLNQRYTGIFGVAQKMPGKPAAAYLGKTAREILGEEGGAVHEAANLRALKGERVVYDWSVPWPEGIAYYQTSLSLLKDPEGRATGLVGVVRDITVQKRAERLLRIQRDLVRDLGNLASLKAGAARCLRAALEVSEMDSGGIYILEPASGDLILVRHQGLRAEFIKRVSRFESGSPRIKLVLKGEPVFTEYIRTAIPKRPVEVRERLRAFAMVPIRHEGKVIGCINVASHSRNTVPHFSRESLETIAHEIGGSIVRLEMKEAFEKGAEKYKTLIETTDTGYVVLDSRGIVLEANQEYARLTGHGEMKEIIGRNVVEWTASYDRRRNALEVDKCLKQGFVRDLEIDYMDSRGRITPVEINATVIRGVMGVQILTLCRDITDRKRAEASLRENEKKYKTLVDTTNTGYVVLDMKGRVLDANQEYVRLSGHKKMEDIIGRRVTEWMSGRNRSQKIAEIRKMLRHGYIRGMEVEHVDGQGNATSVEINATVLRSGKSVQILGMCRDITERKRTEEVLLEREKKFRALIETTREWIWAIDLKGKHTYCNPGFEKILGYPPDEILGMNSMNFIHPDDRPKVRALLKEKSTERDGWSERVVRWLHKDGSYRYLESNAVPLLDTKGILIGYQGADRDITERRRSEEALHQSEMRFRDLTENTSDWIWEVEARMRYVYASPKVIQLLGYAPDEVLGKTPFDFMPPAEAARVQKTFDGIMRNPGPFHNIENVNVCKDGALRVLESSGVPIYDMEGRFTGFRGIDRDVTERKRAEESLRESEERFSRLSAATFEGIGISEQGIIIDANAQLEKMMGFGPGEMIGMNIMDMAAPQSRKSVSQEMKTKMEGAYEHLAIRKDGSIFPVEVRAGIIPYKGKTARVSAIRDITERKQAEEALRQSESKYRSIVLAAPVGVGVVTDRVFREVNDSVCSITGYSREELLNRSSRMVYPSEEEFIRVGKVKYGEIREKGVGAHRDAMETEGRRNQGYFSKLGTDRCEQPVQGNDVHGPGHHRTEARGKIS